MTCFSTALVLILCLLFLAPCQAAAQDLDIDRDSIPQVLRQPQWGEALRHPRDLVIGSLERGVVPVEARRAALEILSALNAGNRNAPSLASLGPLAREELFAALGEVQPRRYRIGEGREETDGACSFLVRFLGRETGIAGELYLRFQSPPPEAPAGDSENSAAPPPPRAAAGWVLDDLLLEEKRPLGRISDEPVFDFPPYERLY
ncbi:MAG: hypothetical protein LBH51_06090 [Treponema sp.]|jgi:hypothetical protein|nr:hypothetical protein [Treponema sp.]